MDYKKKDFSDKSNKQRSHLLQAYHALYGNAIFPKPPLKPPLKPPQTKKKRHYPERTQVHLPLMAWARLHPILAEHLIHIPNERKCTPQQGYMLRMMGQMAGASDLFLAYPTRTYPGFWLELKAPGKEPTPIQITFLRKMRLAGYCTGWYDDWEKARDALERYLQT